MIYSNIPSCDLRNINSVELAKQIEKVENTASVILPNDASDEICAAMGNILCDNVASVIFASKSDDVIVINGVGELASYNLKDNSIIICNGILIADKLTDEIKGKVYLNGLMVINESSQDKCKLSLNSVNGMVREFCFKEYKVFQNTFTLDSDTLKYLSDNTLLIVGNILEIADDVRIEMLENKKIIMFAGNLIRCSSKMSGYIKAKAVSGNGVEIINE